MNNIVIILYNTKQSYNMQMSYMYISLQSYL